MDPNPTQEGTPEAKASSVQDWRRSSRKVVTLPSGRSVEIIRPEARTFVDAGLDPVVFDMTQPAARRREAAAKSVQEKREDFKKAEDFASRIFEACMVAPRFWPGDWQDCPEDRICRRDLGPDLGPLLQACMELAGIMETEEAAEAAVGFRENAGGKGGRPDGETVPGSAVDDPGE